MAKAIGRAIVADEEQSQLKEVQQPYMAHFDSPKGRLRKKRALTGTVMITFKWVNSVRPQIQITHLSKPIIDQIDCLLAQYYGFTHQELDFIINYDIKYRMGKELDSEENNND